MDRWEQDLVNSQALLWQFPDLPEEIWRAHHRVATRLHKAGAAGPDRAAGGS